MKFKNNNDMKTEICKCSNCERLLIDENPQANAEKVEENIYLNRLKEQYKKYKEAKLTSLIGRINIEKHDYNAMRLFCLDTQLVSFNDIEVMENSVF